MEEIAQKAAVYLAHKNLAGSDFEVTDLSRIHGGASRETYRFRARW